MHSFNIFFYIFQATEFCEAHGLPVSDGTVHFNRSSFSQPESAIVAFRSASIIEAKNDKSIGEVGVDLGRSEKLIVLLSSFRSTSRFLLTGGKSSLYTPPCVCTVNNHIDSIGLFKSKME